MTELKETKPPFDLDKEQQNSIACQLVAMYQEKQNRLRQLAMERNNIAEHAKRLVAEVHVTQGEMNQLHITAKSFGIDLAERLSKKGNDDENFMEETDQEPPKKPKRPEARIIREGAINI